MIFLGYGGVRTRDSNARWWSCNRQNWTWGPNDDDNDGDNDDDDDDDDNDDGDDDDDDDGQQKLIILNVAKRTL